MNRNARVMRIWLGGLAVLALTAGRAHAGSTGTSALFTPQGSSTATNQGEYITASTGLDVPFRYFIEVPPGTSQLFVDLFDADIGAGGGAESAAQRDRARNAFNTTVTYRLIDPAGTTVSTLTLDPAQNSTFDNAWTAPFGSRNFRDNFTTASFANDDGSESWSADWVEVDGNGAGATAGNAQISGGLLRLDDSPNTGGDPSLARQADLSAFQGAVVFFDFATTAGVDTNDSVVFEISNNGGTTYTTQETFTNINGASSGSRAFNIPAAFLTSNFRLRFRVNANYGAGNEEFQVDNLEIRVDGRVSPTAGHWQLQVDLSTAVTTGDDIHAFGLRAHDGTSGSGGTELNVYYLSQSAFGTNPDLSRSYTLHPYITSGCSFTSNDFDMDSGGSTTYTSRTGAFTQTLPVSGNDVWLSASLSGWTTDQISGDYGIWNTDFEVTTDATNGNYGHLYLGNFQASAPPPTANPEADTFRVYIPTDAGAAPAKPYLEQLLTFVNGPNPPVAGQTTRMSVTVRLVNPGAQSITFSSPSNVVTANVPGSGVTYAGSAQVSSGSLVSQPSVGGTGDVVWNPGTVPAGATRLLAYRVDVTPAAASFNLPVTGTPASNGTRSQFVDGTGAQTFLFGPLCELRVRNDSLTHATVSDFRVSEAQGLPVVEWQTVSEAGTAGFRVLRREGSGWVQIHDGLLAALPGAPQGSAYRLVDETTTLSAHPEYLLVEVEATGRERVHGPITAEGSPSAAGSSPPIARRLEAPVADAVLSDSDFSATPRPIPAEAKRLTETAGKALSSTDGALFFRPRRSFSDALIEVGEAGLYRVSAQELAAAIGQSEMLVRIALRIGSAELTLQGQPVAWTTPDRGDSLLFYGQPVSALFPQGQPFTDRNVYRLRLARGDTMSRIRGRRPQPATPGDGFEERLHAEQDVTPVTALPLDPDGDFWFWSAINGSRASQASALFDLTVPDASPAGIEATLTLHFQGAAETTHPIEVSADGTFLGDATWNGITPHDVTFPVPHGLLDDGALQVQVEGLQDPGAANQLFVDGMDLDYLRRYRTDGPSVEVVAGGAGPVAVTGFASDDVTVLEITDPRHPRILDRTTVDTDPEGDGFRVTFDPISGSDGRYLLTTPDGLRSPTGLRSGGNTGLDSGSHRAEYLVIAPDALAAGARKLADLRATRGLFTEVVSLEDIYDAFGDGLEDPRAVRDFLDFARRGWQVPPRWVVLAGAGTVDPRDLLGFGGNLFTPLLVSTSHGLFASDARFADFDGDGVAEIAIGRLPMRTDAELSAYVDRLALYESGLASPVVGHALMAADNADSAGDFEADLDRLTPLLPQTTVTRVTLDTAALTVARDQLLSTLAQGVSLFGYVGHSGLDRMTEDGLLTVADVPGLALADRPPVVFALTCTLARFELPFPSLGGELVRSPQGAVAVWAPSGLSDSHEAAVLGDRFLRQLFHTDAPTLGEAVRTALAELRDLGGDERMIGVYNLLGDPALVIPVPPKPPGQGTPQE